VVGVQCGREHTCALHKDSTVDCWGSNQYGQLGDGSKDDSNAPVPVRGF
jgi:alpha-tubulin suppressor-like RCC1 family protein